MREPEKLMSRKMKIQVGFACALITTMIRGGEVGCEIGDLDPRLITQARAILETVPLIDGHNDLPWVLLERVSNQLGQIDLRADHSGDEKPLHTDIPRLRSGGVGGQFWSVYVPVELGKAEAVQSVIEQVDVVHRLAELYPEVFEVAGTVADVRRIFGAGKIASLIGMEGGHSIGNSLAVLRQLYSLGARYMTITHWQNTEWADSATDDPEHDGLAEFGKEVIREMNRLGMIVDLSHVAEKTMHDVLSIAEAPVIFSHSSTRGVTPHPRNVPDSVLGAVASNGGVVMVTFVPPFISEEIRQYRAAEAAEKARLASVFIGSPAQVDEGLETWGQANPTPRASVEDVADHIDYLRSQVGIEHIGLGSDFDGISSTPQGLESVGCFPVLLAELLSRGYKVDELEKISGVNVLRVLEGVESVARELRQRGTSSDLLFAARVREGT